MGPAEVTDIYAKLSPEQMYAKPAGFGAAALKRSTASFKVLDPEAVVVKGHVTHFRLLLTAWTTHFKSLGYIETRTMDMLDRTVCKKIVSLTVRDIRVREAVGTNPKVWSDMVELFRIANPSLEERSYGSLDQLSSGYDGPNSTIIVENSVSLLKDLQRLDNLLAIARNVLTVGERVQNLAAQVGFDREVCSIINLCIKITARGYDGDGTNSIEEDRWQGVINGFKKLLITSLQFLSNLVTTNERLKLLLWVELFDSSIDHDDVLKPGASTNASVNDMSSEAWVAEVAGRITEFRARVTAGLTSGRKANDERRSMAIFSYFVAAVSPEIKDDLIARGARPEDLQPTHGPLCAELIRRWSTMPDADYRQWEQRYSEASGTAAEAWFEGDAPNAAATRLHELVSIDSPRDLMMELGKLDLNERKALVYDMIGDERPLEADSGESSHQTKTHGTRLSEEHGASNSDVSVQAAKMSPSPGRSSPWPTTAKPQPDLFTPPPFTETDFSMMETAEDGARKLREGKYQLLKRLEAMPAEKRLSEAGVEPDETSVALDDEQLVKEMTKPFRQDAVETDGPEPDEAPPQRRVNGDSSRIDPDNGAEMLNSAFLPDEEVEDDVDELEDEGESDEEESIDSGYAMPGEDGRGLLTDVPLILGPNEIEVLPMLVMSGIVAPENEAKEQLAAQQQASRQPAEEGRAAMNMHTIRCHLLLAQENGRNLLRELLIFVAAWDLREEELYFKFMVKIMEAILMNGLMPFAYGAFKESKDIISPAQAVIMKLLTKIFHSRQGFITQPRRAALNRNPEARRDVGHYSESMPAEIRYDIQIVHCLFGEFRQQIIPQICSLIFLQGQIRRGRAALEDFPLNLWDMERMYEGVYQYLEFFAILTDHEQWKKLMADWEVSSELVTLLRELELAIPKVRLVHPIQQQQQQQQQQQLQHLQQQQQTGQEAKSFTDAAGTRAAADASSNEDAPHPPPKAPVSIELPYDVDGPSAPVPVAALSQMPAPPPSSPTAAAAQSSQAQSAALPPGVAAPQPPYPSPPLHDEPADFEWRNLKKLCVLVLSSLVWKNPLLQEQVRHFNGIPVVLSCCAVDEHNPFIREHAIMCLRFLVEGNAENEALVRRIARRAERKASHVSGTSMQTGETYSGGESEGSLTEGEPPLSPSTQRRAASRQAKVIQYGETLTTDTSTQYLTEHDEHVQHSDGEEAQNGEEDDDASQDEDDEYEDDDDDEDDDIVDADFPSLVVPSEVLDPWGYETFMDVHGQVGLRRKDTGVSSGGLASSTRANAAVSGYPDISLGLDGEGGPLLAANGAEGVAKGGKKTGLLESIGGLPGWIKDMAPRS